MAPSILSTTFRKSRKINRVANILFSVTVQDFDGEEMEFEVFADSESEASSQAVSLAAENGMHDVYNTFVYKF